MKIPDFIAVKASASHRWCCNPFRVAYHMQRTVYTASGAVVYIMCYWIWGEVLKTLTSAMSFHVGRRNYVAMHEATMHGMVHVAVVHVALHEAE